MKTTVEISAKDVAAAMTADPDFGAEVLTGFLDEIGRHPHGFADTAMFRGCRVMTANQLRALAAAIQES